MRKNKRLNNTARLALPLLAVIGGFFAPCIAMSVIIWLLAIAASVTNMILLVFDMNETSAIDNILNIANLCMLGVIALPFVFAGLALWGLYKLCCIIFRTLKAKKQTIKLILTTVLLNASLFGITLGIVLPQSVWFCTLTISVSLIAFVYALFISLRQIDAYKQHAAVTAFSVNFLLFTISACTAALLYPSLVSTDWGGLLLMIWLFVTIIITAIFAVIGILTLTVVRMFKHF